MGIGQRWGRGEGGGGFVQTEWGKMEEAYETIFLSIPTLLDADLAPPGRHILHVFTTAWLHDWQVWPAIYGLGATGR